MVEIIEIVNRVVWGAPALILILGVGVYLSIRTRFAQLRFFPEALREFVRRFYEKDTDSSGSSYRALCTALAATVGTGNIAGVAGAIAVGGPGAIFWMWVCALLGMVIKYAEATLAVQYREENAIGEYVGGPMLIIQKGMPRFKWLATLYCVFGVVAAFGVGNATQINAVVGCVNSVIAYWGGTGSALSNLILGTLLAVLVLLMFLGGARRIGEIAECLVPFAAVGYILLCVVVLIGRFQNIPGAIQSIICGAFSPGAVTGGMIGSVFIVLRIGISRGVFTNEAGMGTAAIAHASSDVTHPVEQGLMGIIEVFLDTIVICTMTALVILCSGISIPYGNDTGVLLTTQAFSLVLGDWVCVLIAIFLSCFALATVLGWGLYGIRCAQYLFGDRSWKLFVYLQAIAALLSSVLGTGIVWMLAEAVNGLMSIPNLIALAYLAPELSRLTAHYQKKSKKLRCVLF